MGKIGTICGIIALISLPTSIGLVFVDWISAGIMFAVGISAILFYYTWNFAGFMDNATRKVKDWSEKE